ncbi:MAG: hypothetical protein PHG63_02850 [Candidatus Dojkabacteria bacterium]|nr:hypothetical protein [Candidatus Dojkabacteria bacterium]
MVIGRLKSGESVIDRKNTHLTPETKNIIEEALGRIVFPDNEQFHISTVKFDRVIGTCNVVKLRKGDVVFYARRRNRKGLSKFAKNRTGIKRKVLTVILLKPKSDICVLVTAFVGKPAAREPYDPRVTSDDLKYWKHHALVPNFSEIVTGTIIENPPEYWKF